MSYVLFVFVFHDILFLSKAFQQIDSSVCTN